MLVGAGLLLLARRPLRLPRRRLARSCAMGFLGVPVYNLVFLHGLKTVPTGTAALIIALNPVFTAVLARVVLGEAFGVRRAAGARALALAGVFVVIRYGTDKAGGLALPLERARPGARTARLGRLHVIGRSLPAAADALDTTYALLFVGSLPLLWPRDALAAQPVSRTPAPWGRRSTSPCPARSSPTPAGSGRSSACPRARWRAFVFLNPPLANLWAWLFEGATLRPPFLVGALMLLAGVAAIVLPLRGRRSARLGGAA